MFFSGVQGRTEVVMEGAPVQAVIRLPQSVETPRVIPADIAQSSATDESMTSEAAVAPAQNESTPLAFSGNNGELTLKDAQVLAQGLEQSLNHFQVQFGVSVGEDARSGLHFKVVDKATGRVIREFPPEKALEIKRKEEERQSELGRLFEGVA